jgi:hypothetical protein
MMGCRRRFQTSAALVDDFEFAILENCATEGAASEVKVIESRCGQGRAFSPRRYFGPPLGRRSFLALPQAGMCPGLWPSILLIVQE